MSLPRGLAFEGTGAGKRVVPIAAPPDRFFDDPPKQDPVDDLKSEYSTGSTQAETLRVTLGLLADCSAKNAKKTVIRVAALLRVAGHDRRPVREIAQEIGCGKSTLQEAVTLIEAKLAEVKIRTDFQR